MAAAVMVLVYTVAMTVLTALTHRKARRMLDTAGLQLMALKVERDEARAEAVRSLVEVQALVEAMRLTGYAVSVTWAGEQTVNIQVESINVDGDGDGGTTH